MEKTALSGATEPDRYRSPDLSEPSASGPLKFQIRRKSFKSANDIHTYEVQSVGTEGSCYILHEHNRAALQQDPGRAAVTWSLQSTEADQLIIEGRESLSAGPSLFLSGSGDAGAKIRLGPCKPLKKGHIAADLAWQGQTLRWSSSRPPAGKQLNLFNQGGDRLLAQATAPQGTSGTGSDFSEFTMTISQEPKLLGTAIISAIVCLRAFDEHSQRAVEKKRQLCSILCCLGFGLIGCLVAQCLPYEHSYEDEKCSLQVT